MIFSERYKEILSSQNRETERLFCDEVSVKAKVDISSIMNEFYEPFKIQPDRYNSYTINTSSLQEAIDKWVRIKCFSRDLNLEKILYEKAFEKLRTPFLFDIVELQYEELSGGEKIEFADEINKSLVENDIPWRIFDGKMIKIDAKQFECDLKVKTVEKMKKLKDLEPKFQSAYTELTDAIEYFEKGDYQSAINNAGKSYESILKVILGLDDGNAKQLTEQYRDTQLTVPATMSNGGFQGQVMMALPFIRNKAGAVHGAGDKKVVISKPFAKLAINLAAALDTYLIEEYAERLSNFE